MNKNAALIIAAILLFIAGIVMIILGVKGAILPPAITGIGFMIIGFVFIKLRD